MAGRDCVVPSSPPLIAWMSKNIKQPLETNDLLQWPSRWTPCSCNWLQGRDLGTRESKPISSFLEG